MVLVVDAEEALLFLFNLCKIAVPPHNIVLILVIKDHFGMYKVLNNLLPSAVLQKFWPRGSNSH